MTLKKFLKKYIDAFVDVYNNSVYLGCSDILDKKYKEWRVDKVFPAYSKSDLRCGIVAINIEPPKEKKPKRSTSNKAYKKWSKEYVQDHKNDIGLGKKKDCCSCKHEYKSADDFPCSKCIHVHTDWWEKAD